MKRLLAILTALLLCFPFLPIGGPQALADGSGCFLSGSFPSVYNEVLKRDFLTVLTQDPSAPEVPEAGSAADLPEAASPAQKIGRAHV